MAKKNSTLFSLIAISLGSVILLALVYLGYLLLFRSLQALMPHENENGFLTPMMLRFGYAVVLVLGYGLIHRSQASDLVKATTLTAPLAMLIITAMIRFYDNLPIAFALAFAFIGLSLLLLVKMKKSWIYYYAVALAAASGLFYGWPQGL